MSWISALIDAASSIINTGQTNKQNLQAVKETNKVNREMVEMQNKAAAQESEKAFKRSSAPTQVGLMTSAGMSRAGAINALNGGGSYTPAPVNTSQDVAPQTQPIDFSGLSNLAQVAMQEKQLKQNAQIHGDSIDYEKDKEHLKSIYDKINNKNILHTENGSMPTIDDVYYVLNDAERKAMTNPLVREQVQEYLDGANRVRNDNQNIYFNFLSGTYNKRLQDLEIALREAIQQDTIDVTKKELVAREAKAIFDKFTSESAYDALSNMPKELRQKYYETRALLEWLSHVGETSAEKFIAKARTLLGI